MTVGKKYSAFFILLVLLAFVPAALKSQQSAPKSNQNEPLQSQGVRIGVSVNMVTVPITVRKANGEFIKGLPQSSFRVFEDGKPQEITFFTQEALPTNIAIVLDISESVRSEWGSIKYATKRFIEHLKPEDLFSLLTFNTEFLIKMDWGKKTNKLDAVLSSIYCKDNTKLWDTLWVISTDAFKGVDGKKAIIIMSDGMDTGSDVSFAEALQAAMHSEAAIYVVSKTEAIRQYYEYMDAKVPPEDFARADAALRKFAQETGGRVLYPNTFGQLDDIYAQVDEELHNQYTIGYSPSNTALDGTYRNISVGVALKDAVITARPGYYASSK
jgi:Ca-activated chloride channel family protein